MKKILCFSVALLALLSMVSFTGIVNVHAATVNQVAAVVNGSMISYFDVQQSAIPELRRAGIDPKKSANKSKVKEVYAKVLENLIVETLLVNEAEKNGITATQQEIDAELAKMMQQSNLSKAAFEKQLKSEGLTPGLLRERIQKTIVRQKLMGMMVGRKIVLSPEDVEAYYNENKEKLTAKSDTQLALIVYPNNIDPVPYAKQFAKDSSSFAATVAKISVGPNKENGGSLGSVPLNKLDPRLAKLIESLPVGGVTPILTLNNQKAQFKVVSKSKGGEMLTFEQAKPMIENMLRQPMLQERFEEYVAQLRSRAVVDIRM